MNEEGAIPSVERTKILRGLMMVQLKGQQRKGQGNAQGLSMVKPRPLYLSYKVSASTVTTTVHEL